MSIASLHSYRFGYLKSEQWKTVRLEALARERGKCQVCKEESIFNDAHHIWYPANIYDTTDAHLVVLCRACHDFVHAMRPECKTSDEAKGREEWMKFFNAISVWVFAKRQIFSGGPSKICDLRRAYKKLKDEKNDAGRVQTVIDAAKRLAEQLEQFQKAVDSNR